MPTMRTGNLLASLDVVRMNIHAFISEHRAAFIAFAAILIFSGGDYLLHSSLSGFDRILLATLLANVNPPPYHNFL